jgi:hypothetical protein
MGVCNLKDFIGQIENKEPEAPDFLFQGFAEKGLESIKPHLKEDGYLPKQKCYLMIGWYYPLGGGKMPGAHSETCWDFYTSPFPWGPWKNIGSHRFNPQGYYCPTICSKFTSTDGSTIWASAAGDWTNPDVYRLTMVPLRAI